VQPAELKHVTAVAGLGVKAEWNGKQVGFGSAKLAEVVTGASVSTTTSYFILNGEVIGFVSVEDVVDASAKATVQRLQSMGLKVVMASGDVKAVVEKVATSLGISELYAEQTPAQKIEIIKSLQAAGNKVAMVGDGSNDAPALAQADIGIAMGRGTEIAQATADITLLRADLSLIPNSLGLARQTLRTIKQNLGWAFGYNLAAIPLAMTGNLNPVIAGIAMSASSVLVVTNSLWLRNRKID
jgi:Cu+-exporting ATPase